MNKQTNKQIENQCNTVELQNWHHQWDSLARVSNLKFADSEI